MEWFLLPWLSRIVMIATTSSVRFSASSRTILALPGNYTSTMFTHRLIYSTLPKMRDMTVRVGILLKWVFGVISG